MQRRAHTPSLPDLLRSLLTQTTLFYLGHPKMALQTQASYGLGHYLTGKYVLDLCEDDVLWNLADGGWAKGKTVNPCRKDKVITLWKF